MATGPIPPCMYEYDFTIVDSIIIYPEPDAHFLSDDSLCLNTTESLIFDSEIPIVTGIPVGEQVITNVIWEVENPAGSIDSFTLANGGIVTLTDNLDILFDEIGTWTITITIETNKGCSKQWEKDIFILDLPQPAFSVVPDSTCAGGGNTLYNAWPTTHSPPGPSIETTLPIEYWNWNFDDPGSIGNILTGEVVGDAIHNYTNSGYYNVTLTVIDNFGCEGQIIDTVFISTPIKARAIADTVCFGTPTTLDGTISTLGTTDWFWDLDMSGGTPDDIGPIILYTFPSPGLHTIKLTTESSSIADSVICTDDTVMTVWVRALPQVIFEADTICFSANYPESTNFINNSFEGDTVIYNWQWSFGDNQFSTDSNTTHLYDTCGVYEVILTATDEYLCQNKDTANILVVCPPIAGFEIDTMCFGDPSIICDTSVEGTYNIILWDWTNLAPGSYNPNPNGNDPCITYEFFTTGLQTDETILIVEDEFGCRDTASEYAYVRTNPIAEFSTIDSNYCAGTTFQIFNETIIPPTASLDSIHWTFQTGITSNGTDTITTQQNPVVTFNSPGNYFVELYIRDDKGCYDDTIGWLQIDSLPYAYFSVADVCAKDTAYFWNYSHATTNPLHQFPWVWDFGYSTTSTDSNTICDFTNLFITHPDSLYTGVYKSVSLTVLDAKGCQNTYTDIVKLHPLPEVFLSVDTHVCIGSCIMCINNTELNISPSLWSESLGPIQWSFNGNSFPGPDSLCYLGYPQGIQSGVAHEIMLESWTTWGCTNYNTADVYLWEIPKNDYSIEYPQGQCSDSATAIPFEYITTSGYPLDANYWEYTLFDIENNMTIGDPWIFNELIIDSALPHPGVFNLALYLENDRCTISDTIQLISYPNPRALFTPLDTTICEDNEVFIEFKDLSTIPNKDLFDSHSELETEIIKRNWLLGISPIPLNGSIVYESYEAINGEFTEYTTELTVISNAGDSVTCSDTQYGKIRVNPKPRADFATPTEEEGNYGTYLLNGKTDQFGNLLTTTSNGNYANPNSYIYEWLILDGPFDTVSIWNACCNNGQPYLPSPDSLYYQFQYFLYGEYDSTDICLIVTNILDPSENITKSCADTICKKVKIEAWGQLFVPNALYPEAGDEGSSLFLPKGKSLIEYNLQIFDKFGNLLWENDELNINDGSPKVGWDGTSNGTKLPQGTYVWKIKADFINGPWHGIDNENKKTGVVYLIR